MTHQLEPLQASLPPLPDTQMHQQMDNLSLYKMDH